MTAKQTELIDSFLKGIPVEIKTMFLQLIEYAVELGYTPKRTKTSLFGLDFRSAKLGQTIMKLEQGKPDKNAPEKIGEPTLRLRFFAASKYSEVFENSIKKVIETFNYKYTGCYGCGRCDGNDGYQISYPDGRNYFRCGSELIGIDGYTISHLEEIKQLLKTQNEYYKKRSSKN